MDHIEEIKAAQLAATGMTTREIGQELSVSHSTICRALNKPEIRAIIEKESARLVNCLPDIVDSTQTVIRIGRQLSLHAENPQECGNDTLFKEPNEILKAIELSQKTGSRVAKSLGVEPTHAPSLIFQNIHNDSRQLTIHPAVVAAISNSLISNEVNDDYGELE